MSRHCTTCLAWLPRPSRWPGVAARLRQLAETAHRSDLPVRIVAAIGEPADLGPHAIAVRCDGLRGWPMLARVARYRLLAAVIPADTARIVLRMPGAADPSLPGFLARWGSRTVSEHHGDEVVERLRTARGPLDVLRAGTEAVALRVLLRGVAGALGVTPEIAALLARRGPPGLRTGWTGNGIDVARVRMTGHRRYTVGDELDLVAVVGNTAPWHGLDRLIAGIALHRGVRVRLHVVGEAVDLRTSSPAVEIVRHGHLAGAALDQVLAAAHLGIASLAMHRAGLRQACPLKSREYAARGLPFVYAYEDPGLPTGLPWCLQLPAGDGPLALDAVLSFAANLPHDAAERLRAHARAHLDWRQVLYSMHTQASAMTD